MEKLKLKLYKNKQIKENMIKKLKAICQVIGCSGLDPDMCKNRPYNCKIIRKVHLQKT